MQVKQKFSKNNGKKCLPFCFVYVKISNGAVGVGRNKHVCGLTAGCRCSRFAEH